MRRAGIRGRAPKLWRKTGLTRSPQHAVAAGQNAQIWAAPLARTQNLSRVQNGGYTPSLTGQPVTLRDQCRPGCTGGRRCGCRDTALGPS